MLIWFFWIKMIAMIYEAFKRLFCAVDEAPRKRRADQLDNDLPTYLSPKKHCRGLNNLQGGRLIYADENVEEEVEFINEYSSVRSKERLNGGSCSKRRLLSAKFHKPTQQSYQRNSVSKMNGKESKTKRFSLQSMNAMSTIDRECSTLKKTNQLREKHKYGQLLQLFVPQSVHVSRDKKDESAKKGNSVSEVIDLEKYETPVKQPQARGSSIHKSRELLSTPETSTPQKWYTPRESMNVSVRSITKEKEISILDVRRPSNEKLKDDEVSILSARKIAGGKSKFAFPRESPIVVLDDSENDITAASPRRTSLDTSEPSTSKPANTSQIKIVPVNTLRDNLAAKAVMKEDFIPRVTEQYNERMEQRKKEAEELKRMTCLLSKHNRLTREAALVEQLSKSMKLSEAVLDETADYEDEGLPTLTPAMIQEIKNALVPHPANEVLVEGFGLRITRKDIHTLSGLNWLNDEVINFYMNLLIARGSSGDKYLKVHAMNTFFYPKLLSGGHSSLKRWTRKVDIFAQDLLVVPIHLGIHWCMSVIDFRDKSIRYFDSMGGANPKCLAALRQYLEDESMDKKKKPFDTNDWKLDSVRNIPQQMNGSDCGVFSCMFAEFICADRKITFTQDDMPYFRNKMVYEILKAKLL